MEAEQKQGTTPSWDVRTMAVAKAVCLVGFPATFMLVYMSRRHPSLVGPTAADQIAQLAAAATRWAHVHFAFSVGGFLGIATLLTLRGEVAEKAPQVWTNLAAAIGLVGAVIFTGTVLMEVQVIPALSVACAESAPCLSRDNAVFTQALADQGWRVLPGLTLGGRTFMVGLALLAVLGVLYGALRNFEGGLIFFGAVMEIGANTGLHAWGNFRPGSGMPGIAALALLAAGAAIAWRLIKQAWSPGIKEAESQGATGGPADGVAEPAGPAG